MTDITTLLDKPKIIGIVAETNQGKSNLMYHLVTLLKSKYTCDMYSYGLRIDMGERKIHSLGELEAITDSIVLIDEFPSLFDLDNKKERRAIENSLRLIHHNNNIVVLCGLPDNYKKYISAKVSVFIYKYCKIGSFINGSSAKTICTSYKGDELGATVLYMKLDEALVFDGAYTKIKVPYIEVCDTKKGNKKILEKVAEKVTYSLE